MANVIVLEYNHDTNRTNKDERKKLSNHKFVSAHVKAIWFSGKTLDIKVRQAPFVWFVIFIHTFSVISLPGERPYLPRRSPHGH
jgi:hypothetical protein